MLRMAGLSEGFFLHCLLIGYNLLLCVLARTDMLTLQAMAWNNMKKEHICSMLSKHLNKVKLVSAYKPTLHYKYFIIFYVNV